ncbi:hypothetical protein [Modestobacter italicus]|uniref:hypothetical protein n=1 Tax=Modestobacter italicus (strain DSM 44449 / CECT 9708 / BC 501) TaxID=2732864 RepID=UPI001C976B3B|nr:hypothetical protein [Modestobacter italicus]
MTESTGRTPHTEEPAEGEQPREHGEDAGRTPHTEQPAEGGLEEGLDPESRVTGV